MAEKARQTPFRQDIKEEHPHQEQVGRIIGKRVIHAFAEVCKRRAEVLSKNFVVVEGFDQVKEYAQKNKVSLQFLYGSDHAGPYGDGIPDFLGRKNQFVPAAFIIPQIVEEATDRNVRVVAQYNPMERKSKLVSTIERAVFPLPLRRAVFREAGFIAANTAGVDKTTAVAIRNSVTQGESILIFPEEMHRLDNAFEWKKRVEEKLLWGLITAAIDTGLPIVPIAIDGDSTWSKRKNRQKIRIVFGEPFKWQELVGKDGQELSRAAKFEEVKKRFQAVKQTALEARESLVPNYAKVPQAAAATI